MSPAGSFHSFAPAPVVVKNRFAAPAGTSAIDGSGAVLDRHEDLKLKLFVKSPVKQNRPSKKRRERRPLSCIDASGSATLENVFPDHGHFETSEIMN